MKGKKSSRSAFLTSLMSLVLCFAMLLGTTLAWFTDTATSGVNRIVAGNLDITAEYNVLNSDGNLSDNWQDLQDSTSLFSGNLWEPGHTEYAVIRIKNAGTLALKYQAKMDVVSETGSINVEGKQFKLSDYLQYGVQYGTVLPTVTRESAVTLATYPLGAYASADRNLAVGAGYDYMVLAITMPTTVDNKANYDKQYDAPSVGLGITILATQVENESDSFGTDYDSGAQYDAPTFTTTSNVVFPVKKQATLTPGGTEVTVNLEATTTKNETVSLGSVTVPAGRVEDISKPVVVEVKPAAQGNFAAAAAGVETKYYDISVTNLNSDSGTVTVTLNLDKGLSNVVIKHDNNGTIETIRNVVYNPATGVATFETASFSPFAVEYKAANVAKIDGVYYSSLTDAVAAAKPDETITLLKDSAGDGIGLYENPKAGQTKTKDLTIDFNGFTYTIDGSLQGSTGTVSQAFHLEKDCSVTLKNGTLTSTNAKMLIQNYCNLTLDNMTLTAGSQCGYVLSNNNGNVVIKDTTINAAEGKVAFDVYSFGSYTGANVTVTGNSVINGKIEVACKSGANTSDLALKIASGTINGEITADAALKEKVSITGGTFSSDPSAYLAEGYNVKEINGRYSVYAGIIVCTVEELSTILTAYTSAGSGDNVVSIATDLRLADGEQWVPARVNGYQGAGVITVNGNGHTIYGLNAPLFAGGFAGNSGIVVNDLTLEGVNIDDPEGSSYATTGLGAFIASIDSMPKIELNKCHLKNSKITSASGARVGGLIGWSAGYNNPNDGPVDTYITVTGCSVENCEITAAGSVGAIIGHAGANPATYHTISNNTVKDCKLHSTDDGGWRVGVVVGTANNGQVTISGTTESGNTVTQVGKTAPEHSNLYGRFVPYDTGKLTIDGVAIS